MSFCDSVAAPVTESSRMGNSQFDSYEVALKEMSCRQPNIKRVVDKNVPEACYDLAVCYEKPAGVAENLEKAFELYVKAALHGDKQSFHEVGRCYYYGIGVAQNRNLADTWLERAKEFGVSGKS